MAIGLRFAAICLATPLLLSLAGCSQSPSPASPLALLEGQEPPAGTLREVDLYVLSGESLEVNGQVPFTLRFSTTPDGPGSIPGPELRVTQGDTVRVRLHSATTPSIGTACACRGAWTACRT